MSEPLYYLAAAPKEQVQVRTLTREHGVRQLLEQPPYGRYEGWNLTTLERAELRSGPRLHIQNGERKFIDLHADGTLIAIGKFDGFLGWGRWDFFQQPKVNGLAVIEFTHEFVSFYERVLHEYVEPLPTEVRFAVGVRNAHFEHEGEGRKLYLSPGPISERSFDRYNRHEAPDPEFTEAVDVGISIEAPHLEVGKVATSWCAASTTRLVSQTMPSHTRTKRTRQSTSPRFSTCGTRAGRSSCTGLSLLAGDAAAVVQHGRPESFVLRLDVVPAARAPTRWGSAEYA